jgi:hypothetical protein
MLGPLVREDYGTFTSVLVLKREGNVSLQIAVRDTDRV